MPIKFKVSQYEEHLIHKIAERADREIYTHLDVKQTVLDTVMDLSACVANGWPLRLAELLAADEFNFAHDVTGIRHYLDRRTGKLTDCFSPRYTLRV
jgi:hypothetical protein